MHLTREINTCGGDDQYAQVFPPQVEHLTAYHLAALACDQQVNGFEELEDLAREKKRNPPLAQSTADREGPRKSPHTLAIE